MITQIALQVLMMSEKKTVLSQKDLVRITVRNAAFLENGRSMI